MKFEFLFFITILYINLKYNCNMIICIIWIFVGLFIVDVKYFDAKYFDYEKFMSYKEAITCYILCVLLWPIYLLWKFFKQN